MSILQNARQVFHMVSYLMGNDVGVGKVAVSTQLLLHFRKERQVDVQLLVA